MRINEMTGKTEIEEIRLRYGISKAAMARILGVPYNTVAYWCKNGAQDYMAHMIDCTLACHMKGAIGGVTL